MYTTISTAEKYNFLPQFALRQVYIYVHVSCTSLGMRSCAVDRFGIKFIALLANNSNCPMDFPPIFSIYFGFPQVVNVVRRNCQS